MILPIYAYGQPILKKIASPVNLDDKKLPAFIQNLWDTMYNASGVGLAAPQVGKSWRVFIIDTLQMEDEEETKGIKEVFINPEVIEFEDDEDSYDEGCLSIPDVNGDVVRPTTIKVQYYNVDFEKVETFFDGIEARVFQHEYDHIDGVLFTEKLKPLKRKRILKKLEKIKKGQISTKYKLKFV